ncbi:hypothetical protein DPMN_164085 [Dreissena polymorpha]|uniref:Uncharacterized protein n=1 Tax=Dreissena polymorpha TaxID=45954 RepID=A0A9D4EY01_DREPO|nr:hypothetical protein DPMN_164085 [Dreissena polymorpha]
MNKEDLCPVCPSVFDWNLNTEEEVKLSQRRFSRACPFDNESFGRYLQNEFAKLYQKANNGIAKTESTNQSCSTKSVDSLQTKNNQNDDEYDDYSDFDELLTLKIEKNCTRTRPNSYQKQTEKQRKKAEQRHLQRQPSKRRTKIRNANRDQKQKRAYKFEEAHIVMVIHSRSRTVDTPISTMLMKVFLKRWTEMRVVKPRALDHPPYIVKQLQSLALAVQVSDLWKGASPGASGTMSESGWSNTQPPAPTSRYDTDDSELTVEGGLHIGPENEHTSTFFETVEQKIRSVKNQKAKKPRKTVSRLVSGKELTSNEVMEAIKNHEQNQKPTLKKSQETQKGKLAQAHLVLTEHDEASDEKCLKSA